MIYRAVTKSKFARCLAQSLSVLIAFSFVFPFITWAFAPDTFLASAQIIPFASQTIEISKTLATVDKKYQGNDALVIYIQDLHCNFEVQKNIAALLAQLSRDHGLGLVAVEGSSGRIQVDKLAGFPVAAVKREVGLHFVKLGKLSGPEFCAAVDDPSLELEGIENEESYQAELDAVGQFVNDENQGYVFDLREELENLKPAIDGQELKTFDELRTRFQAQKLSALEYGVGLYQAGAKTGCRLDAYPQLKDFVSRRLNVFPVSVDSEQLFQEMEQLDTEIRSRLYQKPEERELDELLKRLDIVGKLFSISASGSELAAYRQHPELFQPEVFMDFIHKYGASSDGQDLEFAGFKSSLAAAEKFYTVADQRSRIFVENTLGLMQQKKTKLSVLVTGGFHADQVLAELANRHISYVSLKPRLTQMDLVNPYFALLQNRKTPLEKLLAQNQNILGLRSSLPSGVQTAANPQTLPEPVRVFMHRLDSMLKLALVLHLLQAGSRGLRPLMQSFMQIIKMYLKSNQKIQIAWDQAKANEAGEAYLLPLPSLGIRGFIRHKGSVSPGILLDAGLILGDFEVVLLDETFAASHEPDLLGQNQVLTGGWLKNSLQVAYWSALLTTASTAAARPRYWQSSWLALRHDLSRLATWVRQAGQTGTRKLQQWFSQGRTAAKAFLKQAESGSPAMSFANALMAGIVYTVLAYFVGNLLISTFDIKFVLSVNFLKFMPLLIGSVFLVQIALIIEIGIKYLQATPGEEKSFLKWLFSEQVANARRGGVLPEYQKYTGLFTQTWFRMHERVEASISARLGTGPIARVFSHLLSASTDPISGLMTAGLWLFNVAHVLRNPGEEVRRGIYPDEEEMSRQAARDLADKINALVKYNGKAVIGLASGSTTQGVYKMWRENPSAYGIDWTRVHVFHTDEFVGLDASQNQSRYQQMQRSLMSGVGMPAENIHFLNGMADDLERECERYEQEIERAGGIDVQLLGIGRNGHISANEPNVSSFGSQTSVVELMEQTRQGHADKYFNGRIEDTPRQMLSMGMGTIMNAKEIVVLATGAEKAAAVAKALEGPITWRLPASVLRWHERVSFYLDVPAAQGLQKKLLNDAVIELPEVSKSIRSLDWKNWKHEQVEIFRRPLLLLSGLLMYTVLLWGIHPAFFALAVLGVWWIAPKKPEALSAFWQNLKFEFSWPTRWVAVSMFFFGLLLWVAALTMTGPVFIGSASVLGAVYVIWGVYNFFKLKSIVTLDGPDLEAKQDIGMALAETHGYTYVDVAVIYRALALKVSESGALYDTKIDLLSILERTRLDFTFNRRLGRQQVFMDGKDVSDQVLTLTWLSEQTGYPEIARQLGLNPAVEVHIRDRLLRMSKTNNVVIVGQNVGNLLDKYAQVKFYITGDIKARAEQIMRQRQPRAPALSDLPLQLRLLHSMEARGVADRRRRNVLSVLPRDALVIDSTRLSPGDAIERALQAVEDQTLWRTRERNASRSMLSRAEGEAVRRRLFETKENLWVAKSDVDNLSALNQLWGKQIVDWLIDDINDLRVSGLRQPEIRRLTKDAPSIRDGGDESSSYLNGSLSADQVEKTLKVMGRHVKENMKDRYRVLMIQGFDPKSETQSAQLQRIADELNEFAPDQLRISHDEFLGTRLLLRVDGKDMEPTERIQRLAAIVGKAGLGKLQPVDLIPLLQNVPSELRKKFRAKDMLALSQGRIWPEITVSTGATNTDWAFDQKQMEAIKAAKQKKILSPAALMEWMEETDKQADLFLHEIAKTTKGKNTVAVNHSQEPFEKTVDNSSSILDGELQRQIEIEKDIYEGNMLLRVYDKQRKPVPTFDGLAPWALSHAGLRQYVNETLKSLAGKNIFDPQIFIARGPPNRGPDKIQLTVVTPERTYLVELEGRYFGEKFEAQAREALRTQLQEKANKEGRALAGGELDALVEAELQRYKIGEENGHALYKFSMLNNLFTAATGNQMIQAPQYVLNENELSMQRRFVQDLEAGRRSMMPATASQPSEHGENIEMAVRGLVHDLETRLEGYPGNEAKISFTAVYSSMPTPAAIERGCGSLFRDIDITSWARKEKIEGFTETLLPRAAEAVNDRRTLTLVTRLEEFSNLPENENGAAQAARTIPTLSTIVNVSLVSGLLVLGMTILGTMLCGHPAYMAALWPAVVAWALALASGLANYLYILALDEGDLKNRSRLSTLWDWMIHGTRLALASADSITYLYPSLQRNSDSPLVQLLRDALREHELDHQKHPGFLTELRALRAELRAMRQGLPALFRAQDQAGREAGAVAQEIQVQPNQSLRGESSLAERMLAYLLKGILFDNDESQAGNASIRLPLAGIAGIFRVSFLAISGMLLLGLAGKSAGEVSPEAQSAWIQAQSDATAAIFAQHGYGTFLHPGQPRPLSELGWRIRLQHPLGMIRNVRGEHVFYAPYWLLKPRMGNLAKYQGRLLRIILEYHQQADEAQTRLALLSSLPAVRADWQTRMTMRIQLLFDPAGTLEIMLGADHSVLAEKLRTDPAVRQQVAAWGRWPGSWNTQRLLETCLRVAELQPRAQDRIRCMQTLGSLCSLAPGLAGFQFGRWDAGAGSLAGKPMVLPQRLLLPENRGLLRHWSHRLELMPILERRNLVPRPQTPRGFEQNA